MKVFEQRHLKVVFAVGKQAQQQLSVIATVVSLMDLTVQGISLQYHPSGTWLLALSVALFAWPCRPPCWL